MTRESDPIDPGKVRARIGRPGFRPGRSGWNSSAGRLTAVFAVIAILAVSAWTAGVLLTRPPAATPSPGSTATPALIDRDASPSEVALVETSESAPPAEWFASESPSPSPTPERTATPKPAPTIAEPTIPWEDSPGHGLHIYGRITTTSGEPLGGIEVQANDDSDQGLTTSDVLGRYTLHVAAGLVSLKFYCYNGMYATGWLGASGFTYDRSKAIQFDTTPGDVTGADIALPPAITIFFHFRNQAGVNLGPNCDFSGTSVFVMPPFSCGAVVQPGERVGLHFLSNGPSYPDGYYNAASGYTSDPNEATTILIGEESLDITIVVPPAVHVAGQVSVAGGGPLPGNLAAVACWPGQQTGPSVPIGADGSYSVKLGPGTWRIQILDLATDRVVGYYGSTGFTPNYAEATPFVLGGSDLTGIDMVLPS